VKRWVVRELGIDSAAVHTVPLVAFEIHPDVSPPATHPPTVLFFGRIWPYKGLMHLVRAEPAISEAVPDVEIVIAGEGEDVAKYRSAMVHPDRFVVRNRYIPRNELAALLRSTDVVVLPYVDATQSGVVPLAFAYGKPVVATTVGGLPEMVEHGVTGLLVPPGDHVALADAVVRLLGDAELRQRMGAAGRRRACERWSPDAVAVATAAVYRDAVARRVGTRP
jgi:glycosyltransferase involved in cell wall biosynthesis